MNYNIAYISCHSTLEYDELTLLASLPKITVRSIGAYADPRNASEHRPAIPTMEYSEEWMEWISTYEPNHILDPRILQWADLIIYMHLPDHIFHSREILDQFPHKPFIYRSIGQSSDSVETQLANYKRHFGDRFRIIRYSPNEEHHFNYAGSDGLIRFYKDPEEFKGWEHNTQASALFALQAASDRGVFGHFDQVDYFTKDIKNRFLVGPRNKDMEARGFITQQPDYDQYKEILRHAPLLVYAGMIPASYTLTFLEALMTGTPIVSIDKHLWSAEHVHWCAPDVFEVGDLLSPQCVVYSWEGLGPRIRELLSSPARLQAISQYNRHKAVEYFSKEPIKVQWQKLIQSLTD